MIPLLVAEKHDVTALVRTESAARRVASLGAIPVPGDLDDAVSIDVAFAASEASALVNLASLGFGHAPAIVAAAEDAGLHRAVFVSTTSIFTRLASRTRPIRLAAEEAVMGSELAWTIVRPTMIYGKPGDRNMVRLLRHLRRIRVLPLPGRGLALQQPIHVDDLAAAIVATLDAPASIGHAYDLAGPEPLSLRAVFDAAGDAVSRRPILLQLPLRPLVSLARVYEAVAAHPRLGSEQLARLAEDKAVDISAARADLGFDPRSFVEGICSEADLLR